MKKKEKKQRKKGMRCRRGEYVKTVPIVFWQMNGKVCSGTLCSFSLSSSLFLSLWILPIFPGNELYQLKGGSCIGRIALLWVFYFFSSSASHCDWIHLLFFAAGIELCKFYWTARTRAPQSQCHSQTRERNYSRGQCTLLRMIDRPDSSLRVCTIYAINQSINTN